MLMPPLLSCGFPKITHELEWLPHLFVAGGVADLELVHLLEISWEVKKQLKEFIAYFKE